MAGNTGQITVVVKHKDGCLASYVYIYILVHAYTVYGLLLL